MEPRRARQCIHEPDARLDALEKIWNMKFFIGRVHAIVWQRKSHQHGWYAERLLESAQDRDRAAGARNTGAAPKPLR